MKERIDYIDNLRCFGIVLMIMGHVGFGNYFDHWIHAFHMPIWFFISGFFVDTEKETKNYIIKRIKGILIPYILFVLFYILLEKVVSGNWQWISMLAPNRNLILFNGALWFLPALFFADIIGFVVLKYIPSYFGLVLLGVIAIIQSFLKFELPMSIDSAIVGLGFFACGKIIREKEKVFLNLKWYLGVVLVVGATIISMMSPYVNMRTNEYGNPFLMWINALAFIIGLFNLFKAINKYFTIEFIKKIGKNSIIYVCMNQFVLFIISRILEKSGIDNNIVVNIIITLIIIIICYFIDYFINRTWLKIILGKW